MVVRVIIGKRQTYHLFLPPVAIFSELHTDAHEADCKPLNYMMQYPDTDTFKLLSHCTNDNSVGSMTVTQQ